MDRHDTSSVSFLDYDPRETFTTERVPGELQPFTIAFRNQALLNSKDLDAQIHADDDVARRFRSWSVAESHWKELYAFAGKQWFAYHAGPQRKVIQAVSNDAVDNVDPSYPVTAETNRAVLATPVTLVENDSFVELLQRMMGMSDVGVFEYTSAGKLARANDAWYKYSGMPKDVPAEEYSFMDLVYEEDADLVMSQWNSLVRGQPVTFEMRWKKAREDLALSQNLVDGVQWVLSSCVPIIDDDGQLVSIAGNTVDISAQKDVQRQLARLGEVEHQFARFATLAPIVFYMFDNCGKMTYCNDKFFELAGHARIPYHSIDWLDIVYDEDRPLVHAEWNAMLAGGQPMSTQFRLNSPSKPAMRKDAQTRTWAQALCHPELASDGSIKGIMGTLTDISHFKWVEDMQSIKVEEALEAKRQQENFIDMTSHEMRNPLSAVVQCADAVIESLKIVALECQTLPSANGRSPVTAIRHELKESLEALATIISCSTHQKRIIDDILTLSKLDSSLIVITPVPAQPRVVVTETIRMFEVECSKLQIALVFAPDPSLEELDAEWLMLDPSRLVQVLINLLTNAIKFTKDQPCRSITVQLGASAQDPSTAWTDMRFAQHAEQRLCRLVDAPEWGDGDVLHLWIKVIDTGCGIAHEQQGVLFNRFMQATPRTHVDYGGSGLGLYISKSLTELQCGSIGLKSQPGEGSTFAFHVTCRCTLPPLQRRVSIRPRESLPDDQVNDSTSQVQVAMPITHPTTSPYSILVVEDNLVNQKILAKQLERIGCEVHVAGHGGHALDFLTKSQRYAKYDATNLTDAPRLDVVLMDMEMPVMDGLTCTRRIREMEMAHELKGHVPILCVSANARSEQVKHAMDAGVDGAIAKPFRVTELMQCISSLFADSSGEHDLQ